MKYCGFFCVQAAFIQNMDDWVRSLKAPVESLPTGVFTKPELEWSRWLQVLNECRCGFSGI